MSLQEQSPGVNLHTNEKVAIARQLSLLGVDVCEAGMIPKIYSLLYLLSVLYLPSPYLPSISLLSSLLRVYFSLGFPVTSEGDFQAVKLVAEEVGPLIKGRKSGRPMVCLME